MADQADGRVIIDTELDHDGFVKGSEKLKKACDSLTKSVEDMSETAVSSFKQTGSLDAFIKDTEEASGTMENLKEAIDDIEQTEEKLGSQALEKSALASQRAVDSLKASLERMANASAQGFSNTTSVLAFSQNIDFAAEQLDSAKKSLAEFAAQKIPTDEYRYTVEALDKAEKALLKLYDRQDMMEDMGVDESAKQWQRLQLQIRSAEEEVRRYEIAADRMRETGAAFIDPADSEQFKHMSDELDKQEQQLQVNRELIDQEAIAQARLNVQAAQEKLAVAETTGERRAALRELQAAQLELQKAASRSTVPEVSAEAMSGWQRFTAVMRNVGSVTGSVLRGGGNAAKGFFGAIANGAKSAVSALGKYAARAKHSKASTDSLLRGMRSLKQMLISRGKQTFISFLSSTISDSLKELIKFDARLDVAVSNMRNRVSELGANITVSLGGMIKQIEPLITEAIDAASGAVEKLNAVVAALNGETAMTVAAKRTESYAAELETTADKAKKAEKAQKKLNLTLTSYDQIHKLESDDADSASSAAQDAADSKVIFQEVPVASILGDMSDFGRSIVDSIITGVRKGKWYMVGEAIATGVNAAVDATYKRLIDIRPKAAELAQNLADGLNGFLDNFNGERLGKLLGANVNLIFSTAQAFVDTLHWGALGETIADGFNGVFSEIKWVTIGDTIGGGINAAIYTAFGFVDTFDWEKAGKSVSDSFDALVQKIDWGAAGKTISKGFVGIVNSVSTFLEETDWQNLGYNVATFFAEIDWGEAAKAIARGIGAAIGGIGSFLLGIFEKLSEVGTNWGEELFDKYGKEVGNGILAGLQFVFNLNKGFLKWVKENILNPFLDAFKKAFGIASPAKETKPLGRYVADGILNGITGVFSSIGDWIKDNVFKPFKEGMTRAFDIVGDKAREFVSAGKSIAGGIASGISEKWDTVTSTLSEKKDELITAGENFAGSIKTGITSAWGFVTDAVRDGIAKLQDTDTSGAKSAGAAISSSIGEGITSDDSKTGIKRAIEEAASHAIYEEVEKEDAYAKGEFRRAGSTLGAAMGDGLSGSLAEAMKLAMEGSAEQAQGMLDSYVESIMPTAAAQTIGRRMMNGIRNGILSSQTTVMRTVQGITSQITAEAEHRKIGINANVTASGLDAVADKLSEIAQQFIAIGQAFRSIGDVRYPSLAMGTVVPAKTAVTVSADSHTNDALIEKLMQKIDDLQRTIGSRPIQLDSRVNIDGREIGRAAATYTASTSRIGNGGVYR